MSVIDDAVADAQEVTLQADFIAKEMTFTPAGGTAHTIRVLTDFGPPPGTDIGAGEITIRGEVVNSGCSRLPAPGDEFTYKSVEYHAFTVTVDDFGWFTAVLTK